MNFNPVSANQVWAGDVTYLKTGEGWMYLAVVMDLYSRRIVGWHIDKRMTTDLISKALIKAYNLLQPARGLVFHSDCSGQLKLATVLESNQNLRSDSFWLNPAL